MSSSSPGISPAASATSTEPSAGIVNDPEGLVQIREILFGSEVARIESRMNAIEASLSQNMNKLSAEIKHQMQQLRTEVKAKTDGLDQAQRTLKTEVVATEKSLTDLLHEQSELSTTHLTETTGEIKADLKRLVSELDRRKVDRAVLAAFFGETSKGLVDPGLWEGKEATAAATATVEKAKPADSSPTAT